MCLHPQQMKRTSPLALEFGGFNCFNGNPVCSFLHFMMGQVIGVFLEPAWYSSDVVNIAAFLARLLAASCKPSSTVSQQNSPVPTF